MRIDRLGDVSYCPCWQTEMDSRIAQIQQQLREKDAEINILQRELRVSNEIHILSSEYISTDIKMHFHVQRIRLPQEKILLLQCSLHLRSFR